MLLHLNRLCLFLSICQLHAYAAPKAGPPPKGAIPKTMPMDIIPVNPVTHVGLGFIGGFVLSADSTVSYAGTGRLPVRTARTNVSHGFALHGEQAYQPYKTFSYTLSNNPGAKVHLVISDSWTKDGWPYASDSNRITWEQTVRIAIENAVDRFGVDNVVVDIFNEPESLFRGRSITQGEINTFLDTRPVTSLEYYRNWKASFRYIRSLILPYAKVEISGPTISGFNYFILEFLKAAHRDSVLPDLVNWHELDDGSKLDLDQNISVVRAYMSRWEIPARPIGINEYADKAEIYSPGIAIAFFSRLEKSGVATAAKSCWRISDDSTDCDVGSYCGLYTRIGGTFYPRSIWWSYRWYAEASGYRLAEPPLQTGEAFFGSYDSSSKRLQLIFSNATMADRPRGERKIIGARALGFGSLPKDLHGKCRVTLERIKPSGRDAYAAPETIRNEILDVDADLILIKPKIAPETVYRFVLKRL